ncbi:MAG: vitamin K epoxide reductase family protein [Nanoarchaeota archaeon]
MFSPIQIISVIGFLLSIYALYVEIKSSKNKEYKAFCDIKENMSCNKAFSSKYGKTAGLSNSIYGIFFYVVIFLLDYYNYPKWIFYLSVFSFLGSVYLAYISYFKLKNFCLVCTAIYIVNILLLIASFKLVY